MKPAMDFYCDQVLTGQLPVQVVAETDDVLAFHHTQPYWPVHIVVIPKRHLTSLAHLEADGLAIAQEMLRVAAHCGTRDMLERALFYDTCGATCRHFDGKPECLNAKSASLKRLYLETSGPAGGGAIRPSARRIRATHCPCRARVRSCAHTRSTVHPRLR
jgi:hypothetical protein